MNARPAVKEVFLSVLGVGDVIGKLLAFLTLPATLIAGYVYFDEVRDYFSAPDLTTEIRRATLRCNYVWRDAEAYQNFQRGDDNELTQLCRSSPVAVSFEFSVTNNDSIARELKSLVITASVPPYGDLQLDEVQSVEHLIQHGVETNLRRDWRVETLNSGETAIFEILAFGTGSSAEQNVWDKLASLMDEPEPSILNQAAKIELRAQFSGFQTAPQTVLTCLITLDDQEVDQWQAKAPHRRIQITNICA
ncbi:MAG: hypothetical protein AAFR71_09930 [Pseudomonadota bacterium]